MKQFKVNCVKPPHPDRKPPKNRQTHAGEETSTRTNKLKSRRETENHCAVESGQEKNNREGNRRNKGRRKNPQNGRDKTENPQKSEQKKQRQENSGKVKSRGGKRLGSLA